MATAEQIEAWTQEATARLAEKIGPGAQVIVMATDLNGPASPYMIERTGHALGLTWLLQVGRRILEDRLLPKPTITRNDVPGTSSSGG